MIFVLVDAFLDVQDIPLGGAAGSGTSPRKKRGLPRPEARDPGLFISDPDQMMVYLWEASVIHGFMGKWMVFELKWLKFLKLLKLLWVKRVKRSDFFEVVQIASFFGGYQ